METGCACHLEYEPPEFINFSEPVARKDHWCCECGEAIPKGTKYEYVAGLWYGFLDTFKTCLICARIRQEHCCCFGGVRDELWECLGMDYVTGEMFNCED